MMANVAIMKQQQLVGVEHRSQRLDTLSPTLEGLKPPFCCLVLLLPYACG